MKHRVRDGHCGAAQRLPNNERQPSKRIGADCHKESKGENLTRASEQERPECDRHERDGEKPDGHHSRGEPGCGNRGSRRRPERHPKRNSCKSTEDQNHQAVRDKRRPRDLPFRLAQVAAEECSETRESGFAEDQRQHDKRHRKLHDDESERAGTTLGQ